MGAGDGFDKQASELAIFEQEIIGPFPTGLQRGEGANGIGDGQSTEQGKQRETGWIDGKKQGNP